MLYQREKERWLTGNLLKTNNIYMESIMWLMFAVVVIVVSKEVAKKIFPEDWDKDPF